MASHFLPYWFCIPVDNSIVIGFFNEHQLTDNRKIEFLVWYYAIKKFLKLFLKLSYIKWKTASELANISYRRQIVFARATDNFRVNGINTIYAWHKSTVTALTTGIENKS